HDLRPGRLRQGGAADQPRERRGLGERVGLHRRRGEQRGRDQLDRVRQLGHALQSTDAELNSTFYSYDAAGRVAKTWQPITETMPGGGTATANRVEVFQYDGLGNQVATVDASTSWNYVDAAYPQLENFGFSIGVGVAQSATTGRVFGFTFLTQPTNVVNVSWGTDLTRLGGGAVYVQIGYNYATGGAVERGFWVGNATTGTSLSWNDGQAIPSGVSSVYHVMIYKQNAAGDLVLLNDTNANGWSSNL